MFAILLLIWLGRKKKSIGTYLYILLDREREEIGKRIEKGISA